MIAFIHQGSGTQSHLSRATLEMLHVAQLDPESNAFGAAGVSLFGPGALNCTVATSSAAGGEIDITAVADGMDHAGGQLTSFSCERGDATAATPGTCSSSTG